MNPPRALPFLTALATLVVLSVSGCSTTSYESAAPARAPFTYAIILYMPEGENLDEDGRLHALSLARDTLLAAGLVTVQDRMISDPERAQFLYRAQIENGVLLEIAGVPSVSNSSTVVLSRPHYYENRVMWDTRYPFGYPSSYYDNDYGYFPLPGPGWGYPGVNRGYDRDRNRDRHDGRDREKPNKGDRDGNRPDRPDRDRDPGRNDNPDRDRNNRGVIANRGAPDPDRRPEPRIRDGADSRTVPLPIPPGDRRGPRATPPTPSISRSTPRDSSPAPTVRSSPAPEMRSSPAPYVPPPTVDRSESRAPEVSSPPARSEPERPSRSRRDES